MDEKMQDRMSQGVALMAEGRYAEAERLFAQVAKADPRNKEAYVNLGNAQLNQDKFDEGIATFKKALLVDENDAEVLRSLGYAYFLKLDYANALRYLNRVEELGAATPDMYSIEAAMFLDSDDFNMAVRSINRAIALRPLNVELRLSKAQIYEQAGRIDEAVAALHDLQELLPDEGSAYGYEARLLIDADRADDALAALARMAARFPQDPTVAMLRARALNTLGRHEEALAEADRGIDIAPEGSELAYDLLVQTGIALGGMGRVRESLAVLERAARMGNDVGTYFLALNECLALREYDKALTYADKILACDDLDPSMEAAGVFFKPFSLEKLGRTGEAMALYREAAGRLRRLTIGRPELFDAYTYRVMVHRALGEYDEALEIVDYLIALDDSVAASHALKYQVLASKGDAAEAAKERARALALDPSFVFEG